MAKTCDDMTNMTLADDEIFRAMTRARRHAIDFFIARRHDEPVAT